VPQRLHVIDVFSSDHAQHVGQHTATAIGHSCQRRAAVPALSADGATLVTGSNHAGKARVSAVASVLTCRLHSRVSIATGRSGWLDPSELRIGLGCMRLSTDDSRDERVAFETIGAAVDAGVTVFDTAHAYGHDEHELGHNEGLLARALRNHDAHRSARIVTKGGMRRDGGRWIPDGRARAIFSDCESSLSALDGLPIDLYLIHAPDPRTPWRTSMRALARLLSEGLVRHVGISNVSRHQLDEALEIVDVTAVENALSVYDDSSLRGGIAERCAAVGTVLIAHSPLGGPRRANSIARHPALIPLAEARSSTAAEVALAWLLELSPAVVAIPGARRPETARSSARAARLDLGAGERAILARAFGSVRPGHVERPRGRDDADVVVIIGVPGSGKSRVAETYVARGYRRLNRDERGGSLRDLAVVLDEELTSGARRIVLDNTYLTRSIRNPVIETAHRHGIAVRCIWCDTTLAQAQVNLVERILERFGSLPAPEELRMRARLEPGILTPTSQMRTLREFEPPSPEEGFAVVERTPFARAPVSGRARAGVFVAAEALARSGWSAALAASDPDVPHLVFDWTPAGSTDAMLAGVERLAGQVTGIVEGAVCAHAAGPPVCWCRPPLPGLPLAFARAHGVDPTRSALIGTGPAHRTLASTLGSRYLPV
jgi:aryl-alcohol dehydrogenase-like predicted oxidoreductase